VSRDMAREAGRRRNSRCGEGTPTRFDTGNDNMTLLARADRTPTSYGKGQCMHHDGGAEPPCRTES
jgi:hypothetical protein